MERAVYGWGALLGILVSVLLVPSYEASDLYYRAVVALIMLVTALCICGYVAPLLPKRD